MTQLLFVVALIIASASPLKPCSGAASAPALDHVILVVRNIDQASAMFRKQGFRLKRGRLHANNLLNRHVKFRDGTSIELMTLQGEPRDAMARDYADLLAAGEGGVYVSLSAANLTAASRSAEALRLEARHSSSGPWRFLSFPPNSPAAAVFFSSGGAPVQDPDSLLAHEPAAIGLIEAWVEGGVEMGALLARLGAKRCGAARAPDGRAGERWGLSRGTVVIVPADPSARPRVLGVVLQGRNPGESVTYPHRQFWVRYQFQRN